MLDGESIKLIHIVSQPNVIENIGTPPDGKAQKWNICNKRTRGEVLYYTILTVGFACLVIAAYEFFSHGGGMF